MKYTYNWLFLIFFIIKNSYVECDYKTNTAIIFSSGTIAPSSLVYLFVTIDIVKTLKNYIFEKQKSIQISTYQDFIKDYSYMLPVFTEITSIQKWLHNSRYGTLPEKIMARIYLSQDRFCYQYNCIVNRCAQKLRKKSFDIHGRFIWKDKDPAQFAYKSFYKKVPQAYQGLIADTKKWNQDLPQDCKLDVKYSTQNDYNQKLLDIIYAEIDQNYPRLKQLCRKGYDCLIDRLYDYYESLGVLQNVEEFEKYELSEIITDALQYSSWNNDYLVQQIADSILKVYLLSYQVQSDELDEQLSKMYKNLLEQIE